VPQLEQNTTFNRFPLPSNCPYHAPDET